MHSETTDRESWQHPLSVPGDFYVENGCCLACGVPEHIAPDLIGQDESGHCYWKKQPTTPSELDRAIKILHTQELDCHKYCGSDLAIIDRLPWECCQPPAPSKASNLTPGATINFRLKETPSFFERFWRKIKRPKRT